MGKKILRRKSGSRVPFEFQYPLDRVLMLAYRMQMKVNMLCNGCPPSLKHFEYIKVKYNSQVLFRSKKTLQTAVINFI